MGRFRFLAGVLSLFMIVQAAAPGAEGAEAATANPSQVVARFHDGLLDIMKNAQTLGVKGRYESLAPSIKQSFHLRLMVQVAASSYWRKASPEQIEKLVQAFTRLSISTYASQFDGFSGQSFETRGEKPGPQKTTLVETRIIDPGSDPVELIYVTRLFKGQWRIIDVLVDSGISQLAVRRSEYRQVLRTKGIDGLISTLNAKADQLLSE